MTPGKRYSLIATGIVAFVILAPFIVLFVTGTKYDFKLHKFIKTGALVADTSPTGAKLYLNGKISGTTNKTVRFITPGDYQISIKKDGYFDWSKNLTIRPELVTWANQDLSAVTLFYSQPKTSDIASSVNTFAASDKRLVYLRDDGSATSIVNTTVDHPDKVTVTPLPAKYNNLQIVASKDNNLFLLYESDYYAIFDASKNTVTNITDLATAQPQPADSSTSLQAPGPGQEIDGADVTADGGIFEGSLQDFQFGDDGSLYILDDGEIYKIDWQNNKKTSVIQGALAFRISGQAIYFIKLGEDSTGITRSLAIAQLPNYQQTILQSDLPPLALANLYITDRNQLFLLGNGSLYSVGDTLNKIADYVQNVVVDNDSQQLLYSTDNEIDSYDITTGDNNLVTRSSQQVQQVQSALVLGWVFYLNNGNLQSIETDNRGSQNNYTFTSVADGSQYWVSSDAKDVILLDQGKLEKMEIR